ncbi:hypothetical protein FZ041_00930 [Selenomonas caprae]|uniref:Uncharacterized protein n=1 Tax=Selenomonas caprae TaxID=2606905 RepID=A0A5D6WT24_9FIRM|nr:hypothetical protein [Selenomonas caprae]TYZ31103.1 hypothetical protein FZ041_00930 [Selenomonas caprae]
MTIVYVIVGLIVLAAVAAKLYLAAAGIEDIRVDTSAPVVVEAQDDNSIVLSKKLNFYNEGKQCATIMDAICRSQLPYEQYDGIEVRGKAEREGEVREDDYFEAVLIQKKGDAHAEDKLNIFAKVKLTPRKGQDLKTALSHMVDLPLDFIWMETGRTPWHYRKIRLVFTAEEIAQLAGVQLVQD